MRACAEVTEELLAPGVWHVGLFRIETALEGRGAGARLFATPEAWALAGGARWLRLGVVAANARGHGFWLRLGFVETGRRPEVAFRARVHELVVMVKPLAGAQLATDRALVRRDRPDTAA